MIFLVFVVLTSTTLALNRSWPDEVRPWLTHDPSAAEELDSTG